MNAYYELMDVDSANVVGFYDTRDDALATERDAYERYGLAGVEDLVLSETSDEGKGVLLGQGVDLLRLTTDAPLSPVGD